MCENRALGGLALALARGDPRRMAHLGGATDKPTNQLPAGTPMKGCRFIPNKYRSAAHS